MNSILIKMRIAVYGAWHVKNFGDILLFDLYCQAIREVYPDSTIIALEASDALNRSHYMSYDRQTHSADAKQVLKSCDLMMYLGGGYFQEPDASYLKRMRWGLNILRKHMIPALYAKYHGVPIRIIGVGVGPITNPVSHLLVKLLYWASDKAAVRDLESKLFLIEKIKNSIGVIPDLGLYTKEMMNIETSTKGNKLGVHLYDSPSNDRRLCGIVKFLRKIHDEGDNKIYFVKDKGGKDKRQLSALSEVKHLIDGTIEYASPRQFVRDLNSLDSIITTKLHVGVVGVSLGKTVVSIPYHPKTKRFYNQVGRPDLCLDLNRYTTKEIYSLLAEESGKTGRSEKYQVTSYDDVLNSLHSIIG